MSPDPSVLPDVEADPAAEEPVVDGLPDVDDPRTDAEELESLREFADGAFACYDAVRKTERLVEAAKTALRVAKAEFDTAVANWGCSYTEQNRHPLFGDPLEQDGDVEKPACPNCGSAEVDEDDGACAKCHEPNVAPVSADEEE